MNEPVTIERALIGREIALEDPNDENHPPSVETKAVPSCRKLSRVEGGFQFNGLKSSNVLMTTKRDDLTKNFEISATVRTLDNEGVLFVVTVKVFATTTYPLFHK